MAEGDSLFSFVRQASSGPAGANMFHVFWVKGSSGSGDRMTVLGVIRV